MPLVEPLGSVEPQLKNTGICNHHENANDNNYDDASGETAKQGGSPVAQPLFTLTLRARGTSYLVQYWYWLCATYEITRTPLQQSYHVSSASVIQSAAL